MALMMDSFPAIIGGPSMAETAGTKGLTATAVKNARAKDKAYKLSDRDGFLQPMLIPVVEVLVSANVRQYP